MKLTLTAAASLLVLGLATSSATAAAVSLAKDLAPIAASAAAPVERVHFRHRTCQLGGRGWHYHRYDNRYECRPFRRRSY